MIRWTRPALADLEGIGDFIARDNPAAAKRIVVGVVASVDALRDHPNLGRPGRLTGTRELVVSGTPYLVPYRALGDDVEILAVFHGARRWPDAFE
ncbi:MAG TPA: type II toxin-antitoxin system RelE/ParE family toxin [Roseiarcus sp.]